MGTESCPFCHEKFRKIWHFCEFFIYLHVILLSIVFKHFTMKRLLLCLATILTVVVSHAQPKCNDDGSVTFYYHNESAKSVMVDVQFAGRNEMKKDPSTGVWSVQLGPVAPDMYPYCFIVDGISVMDPENPHGKSLGITFSRTSSAPAISRA